MSVKNKPLKEYVSVYCPVNRCRLNLWFFYCYIPVCQRGRQQFHNHFMNTLEMPLSNKRKGQTLIFNFRIIGFLFPTYKNIIFLVVFFDIEYRALSALMFRSGKLIVLFCCSINLDKNIWNDSCCMTRFCTRCPYKIWHFIALKNCYCMFWLFSFI